MFPTVWCPGCGNGLIIREIAKVFDKLNFSKKDTVVVSGIGCAGRMAGYFELDSVHGLHGRALPLAEGIKLTNPGLNVIVASGDGDIGGIGGNHLLHTSRRDADLTVICVNNQTYGMTGGQLAPTTGKGMKTITTPEGSPYNPINFQGLLTSRKKHFYARTTVFHIEHLNKCIEEAIKWKGFAFVEVINTCITNYARRLGFKSGHELLLSYRDNYTINSDPKEKLADNELGILKKE